IVTNRSARVQHRIEDVPLLITRRAVGCGMVAVAGQDVGRAGLERRGAGAIRRSWAGWIKGKVACGSGIEVGRNVAVLAFAFIRKAAVDTRIVDLLREGLRIGRAAAHGPGPAVHGAVAGVHEVVYGYEVPRHAMEAGCDLVAEKSQRRIAVGTIAQIAKNLIERTVFLHDVDDVFDF